MKRSGCEALGLMGVACGKAWRQLRTGVSQVWRAHWQSVALVPSLSFNQSASQAGEGRAGLVKQNRDQPGQAQSNSGPTVDVATLIEAGSLCFFLGGGNLSS